MKLFIPTILAATILIAGAFALLPVQEAVTLHLTGGGAAAGVDTVDSAAIVDGSIVTGDLNAAAGITGAQLAAGAGIVTGQIADNTITGADFQPTTSATAAIPTRSTSTTAATALSAAFSPAAASTVIVIASADVLEVGTDTANLILTITEDGANCAVVGGAVFQTALANSAQGAISGMAVFTGCDDANTVFTSTLTASGTFGDTVNRHNITTIWLEE